MNAGEIVLLLFGLLFLLGGYRLYLAIIAAIGFILGALILGPILFGIIILAGLFG